MSLTTRIVDAMQAATETAVALVVVSGLLWVQLWGTPWRPRN